MSSVPEFNQRPKKKDPVDALADLAGGKELEDQPAVAQDLDPLAALSRLADGDDPATAQEKAPPSPPEADQYALADEPAAAAPAPARCVSVRTRNTIEAKAIAHSYKKTMIPLLLLVGVLLAIISGVCVYIYAAAEPGYRANSYHRTVLLLAVLSVPLALAMFLGAWWFHHETSGQN
jgi:hypothetical protein